MTKIAILPRRKRRDDGNIIPAKFKDMFE